MTFWDNADALPGSVTARAAQMPACDRLAQPVSNQVADVRTIAEERWPLTLAALAASPWPRVVEGESILPGALAEMGVPATHAVFLTVEPAARRARYASRGWARELVADCADPAAAMEAWMLRDDIVQERIAREAIASGYGVFDTNNAQDVTHARELIRAATAGS